MGILTSLTTMLVAISFVLQNAVWEVIPGGMLPKLNVISMLSALIARKTLYGKYDDTDAEISLPTIRIDDTLLNSAASTSAL
ncbi:hypothetical protein L210DRAFT_2286259 [Boletus edulis BED1]|uniref:Uncharacterized protein n=1 Tax=Boletus edulis BED1 TaxID=1328754 RepID=A0AAD4BCT7_BOLED|nr:hypothetical protein L210DRAFT_2286259 [Boletus edulis BED1]